MTERKSRGWLKQKYTTDKLTTTEIAEICNVNYKTIIRWMNFYEIPIRTSRESLIEKIRTKNPSLHHDKKWLHDHYINRKLSSTKIAKMCNVHSQIIRTWLNIHEIKIRSLSEAFRLKDPCSEETKRKLSKAHQGKVFSESHRRRISESRIGEKNPFWNKNLSCEHRENISHAKKGKKRPPFSDEWKRNIGLAQPTPILIEYNCEWCGIIWLARQKGRARLQQKHFCCNLHNSKWRSKIMMRGENNPNYGNVKLSGSNNPNWRGGVSYEPYGKNFNRRLKVQIRERDGYICRICELVLTESQLPIHHIDYNKKNNLKDNLITLCFSCHSKTNFNRTYWHEYFRNHFLSQPTTTSI